MFLEDEVAVNRIRVRRMRTSLTIAVIAVAASLMTGFGFISTARAEEAPRATIELINMPASINQTIHNFARPASATTAFPKHHEINGNVMRGMTLLVVAMTGLSLLTIWRRRIRDMVFPGDHVHAK
ncbi:hypothetical protein [Oryzifoliimicrobium ureilyticus]|uniref:hypothetical protein n=1 Tax=Oryzifoliimicrobium ureilyticus TaxID=3113724 RepID=UPI00307610D3